MVRSKWLKPLWGVLACTSLAWGQGSSSSAQTMGTDAKERFVTVSEADKPAQRCKLLKAWQETDGRKVYLVQVVATGEFITVVEPAKSPAATPAQPTKLYHWSSPTMAPANAPVAPANAIVYGTPITKTTKTVADKTSEPVKAVTTNVVAQQSAASTAPKATNWRESWGQADPALRRHRSPGQTRLSPSEPKRLRLYRHRLWPLRPLRRRSQ